MNGLSSAQFAAYAREQIRNADLILTGHIARGPMCACGRLLPCSVATTVVRRRSHFVVALARVAATPAVGRVAAARRARP
ncbi:MAG: hypothetical protein ACRDJ9_18380 [Dehalococcoidia bacterium]